MTTNTKVTLIIAAFALVFLATTALATTAYWSQRDKRVAAETTIKTSKQARKTDSLNHVDKYEALADSCDTRAEIDRKTIETLMKQKQALLSKLKVGKGANVTINVAP